jgi:hypothetical protein
VGNEWVTKEDGAEQTDLESFKGGLSSAIKRAAVVWGIGRYLYDLEEGYAEIVEKGTKGAHYGKLPDKTGGDQFHWFPPRLPSWALPKQETHGATGPKNGGAHESSHGSDRNRDAGNSPVRSPANADNSAPNAIGARDIEDLKGMMVKRQKFGWTYENFMKYVKAAYDRNTVQELTVEQSMELLLMMEAHTCAMAFAKLNTRKAV